MKYKKLVKVYDQISSTTKRLDKTFYLSEFLKQTNTEDLGRASLLIEGRVFPNWDERKIGVASKTMIKALGKSLGISESKIKDEWRDIGDLGEVAEKLAKKKSQSTLVSHSLTVKKVFENIRKLPQITGTGTVNRKIALISELLTSATPQEIKYLVRFILEDLRIGVGEGTLRDALVWAFFPKLFPLFQSCPKCQKIVPRNDKCIVCQAELPKKPIRENPKGKTLEVKDEIGSKKQAKAWLEKQKISPDNLILAPTETVARKIYDSLIDAVQHAFDLTNDFGLVARTLKEKGLAGLEDISIHIGQPIKVMLAIKAKTMKEAFETVGKPAELEQKYDGFRLQIHKNKKDRIFLFTRRLDDITKQFPDIVDAVKKNISGKSFILDSEAVGFNPKTNDYLPFQRISQRIKRKHNIEAMAKKFPVEVNIFDIISFEGESYLNQPLKKRRKLVEKIVKTVKRVIQPAKNLVTSQVSEAEEFFKQSREDGHEGIMFKKLDAPYKPGARVGYMVKYKEAMETLDLVIVGAEWGTGKRGKWLSSFVLACKKGDDFVEVGKVGTGIKEKEEEGLSFEELTEMLKPLVTSQKGRSVKTKPKIVLEIDYEEIQKSPTYSSGYALRFPRVVRLRDDKSLEDVSSLKMVKRFYHEQKKG